MLVKSYFKPLDKKKPLCYRDSEMKAKYYNVRLDEEAARYIEELALKSGMKDLEFMRMIVIQYLMKHTDYGPI